MMALKSDNCRTKTSPSNENKHDTSWYEMTVKEEQELMEDEMRQAANDHQTRIETSSDRTVTAVAVRTDLSEQQSVMSRRQIEIDILDSKNVKKYEELVKSDKIKSPFKRRLSDENWSSDDESGSSGARGNGRGTPGFDRDRDDDDDRHMYWKKSKKDEYDRGSARWRRESSSSGASSQNSGRRMVEFETDEAVLSRRQKQIDYGKNTLGYTNYIEKIPRNERTKDHPKTPQKHMKYSRRAWDGVIKVWRKQLHVFDPSSKCDDDE